MGGAVRDRLLGLDVNERDWVVVGSSPQEMKSGGYRPVGKDFPVFLHPETAEEYALARTERKSGTGYHGFSFHTDADVTLEEDLIRRDLTINAIAEAPDGTLIDPYGGQADIEARLLRHVSEAFAEDPLRVLRVARFACRFEPLGFRIHEDTEVLMRQMVDAGEVDTLQRDRVWAETLKALRMPRPSVYFEALRTCGALKILFPWIERLYGVPQPERWHPEIDTGVHTMMVLDAAAKLSDRLDVRFAALTHDLGKGTTDPAIWPSHKGHEARSVELLGEWTDRFPVANEQKSLALLVAEWHGLVHRVFELRPATLVKLLERCDATRRPDRFDHFLMACEADARGRTNFENAPYPQADFLRRVASAVSEIDVSAIVAAGFKGPEIGEELRKARIHGVKPLLREAQQAQEPPKK